MPFTQEYSSQYHVFEILWDSSERKTVFGIAPLLETDVVLPPSVYAAETPARAYIFHPRKTLEYSVELEKT